MRRINFLAGVVLAASLAAGAHAEELAGGPTETCKERLWKTSSQTDGGAYKQHLINEESKYIDEAADSVSVMALAETAYYIEAKKCGYDVEVAEAIMPYFDTALAAVFTQKNELELSEDDYLTWNHFGEVGRKNNGLKAFTPSDISEATVLAERFAAAQQSEAVSVEDTATGQTEDRERLLIAVSAMEQRLESLEKQIPAARTTAPEAVTQPAIPAYSMVCDWDEQRRQQLVSRFTAYESMGQTWINVNQFLTDELGSQGILSDWLVPSFAMMNGFGQQNGRDRRLRDGELRFAWMAEAASKNDGCLKLPSIDTARAVMGR